MIVKAVINMTGQGLQAPLAGVVDPRSSTDSPF